MILTVGNIKGGVGKTTLAVNIAIERTLAGRDVLLVDADEQGTAATFTQLRTEQLGQPGYTAIRLHGGELRQQIRQLAPKYDDIIIDVGGRDTGALRAALLVSDAVLIPVLPRSFDLWSVEQMAEVVAEVRTVNERLDALTVLSCADAQGKDNEDASAMIRDIQGLRLLPVSIIRRKAWSNAAAFGRSVLDHQPRDARAVQELQSLSNTLFSDIGKTSHGHRQAVA